MFHKLLTFVCLSFLFYLLQLKHTKIQYLGEKNAFCLKTSNNSQLDYQKHIPSELNLYKYTYSRGLKKKKRKRKNLGAVKLKSSCFKNYIK